ncbi:MAG TPA: hypothetical protein GXX30_08580 [Firmicutes bacterium]|nr:hypothetical protein [Candidatus Fermentithermobacillaceae bacterium]
MTVSQRRFEFLKVLGHLAKESGAPVHYADVASRLSVSKWTAYDMLRELVKDGLVKVSYSTASTGLRGRSQVLFEPTRKGLDLLGSSESGMSKWDNWHEVSNHIISRVSKALADGTEGHSILEELQDMSPLAYCAGLLAILIIEFKKRQLDLSILQGILYASTESSVALSVLIGLLAGGLLVKGAFKIIPGLDTLVEKLSREVSQLEDGNRIRLLDFAKRVLWDAKSA